MNRGQNEPGRFQSQASAVNGGAAPPPQRSLTMGSPQGTDGDFASPESFMASPGTNGQMEGINASFQGYQTSNAPGDPGMAAEIAELRSSQGKLIQTIGEQRLLHEQQLREQNLRFETLLATAAGGNVAPQQNLPPGVDPDSPMTMGQFFGLAQSMLPVMTSDVIRRTWDVTQEEQNTVLASNPLLNNVPEPRRTDLLKQAVGLLRENRTRETANGSSNGQSNPGNGSQRQSPQNQRPLNESMVVPQMENSNAQGTNSISDNSQSNDAYQAAWGRYTQLKQQLGNARDTKQRKEILAQMKSAYRQAQFGMGISDEEMAHTGWSQT